MSAEQRLAGKVGIITGGAAGIGKAVCERFGQEGASVVVADYNRAESGGRCCRYRNGRRTGNGVPGRRHR